MATINANKNSPRLVKGYLDVSYGLAEVPIFPVKSRKSAKRVGGRGWCAKTHTGLGVNGYECISFIRGVTPPAAAPSGVRKAIHRDPDGGKGASLRFGR